LSGQQDGSRRRDGNTPTAAQRHLWASRERADQVTFRAGELLISREVQTCLDDRQIKEPIIFAAHHEGAPAQIGQDGSGPLQTIKPQQSALVWKLVCFQVGANHLHPWTQLLSLLPVAGVARSVPSRLSGMRLPNGRTGTHDFPSLTTRVARSAHVFQPTPGDRQLRALR
jgi:hypothetical protein